MARALPESTHEKKERNLTDLQTVIEEALGNDHLT
jgi:hypothetical protein